MATKKISQLTPKGANLAATDLLEISEFDGSGYVTKSITGQEIIDSAVGNVDWGDIGGTLSDQTDLQTALNGKQATLVSGTNIKTINGTSVLGSGNIAVGTVTSVSGTAPIASTGGATPTISIATANTTTTGALTSTDWNTFNGKQAALVSGTNIKTINGNSILGSGDLTISTGLTIGTTAIASGTVGRVLFEGTGNVVSESANLFWDNTNGRLGIGGTPGAFTLDVNGTARTLGVSHFRGPANSALGSNLTTTAASLFYNNTFNGVLGVGSYSNSGAEMQTAQNGGLTVGGVLILQRQGGNVLINTTTDAGFRLDVNGTARVSGQFDVISGTANFRVVNNSSYVSLRYGSSAFVEYNTTEAYFSTQQVYFSAGANFRFNGVGQFGFTGNPNASAQLQVESTTKGFLPPRMTTTQKNAIATPATGLQVFDTTLNQMSYYNGTTWINL